MDEKACVTPTMEINTRFKATLLEKVQPHDGDFIPTNDEFYPVLRRMLVECRNWGFELIFKGMSSFIPFLKEWTEHIMYQFEQPLRSAGIYGLAAVSQHSYNYEVDVWRAFCELWSPLTNTLHHGGGEVGISLFDLKKIGGLPILGAPYEEYLLLNEDLLDNDSYPSTVAELLRIHAALCCDSEDSRAVRWPTWVNHFCRRKQVHFMHGDSSSSSSSKRKRASKSSQEQLPLEISSKGELAAFIALLLSRFALPDERKSVRPETFVIASRMAEGVQVSLAPTVLGHIYHGLGKMATYKGNPGNAKPSFGMHFVVDEGDE